jgi:hypothetical protein
MASVSERERERERERRRIKRGSGWFGTEKVTIDLIRNVN